MKAKRWAVIALLLCVMLCVSTALAEKKSTSAEINLTFDGVTFTDTVQLEWEERYVVPEGGVKWDGTEDFIGYVDVDDWKVIDADRFSYAEGQIAFVANKGIGFDEIEQLAALYDARIVAYIAWSRDYVIELISDKSFENMRRTIERLKIREELIADSIIPHYVSYLTTNRIQNDLWKNADWAENNLQGENWGVEAIRAISAWNYSDFMLEMNIGIIDSSFERNHPDIDYAIIYSNESDTNSNHGTQVAGIALAKHNNIGINGVFPKGKLVGVGRKGVLIEYPQYWVFYKTQILKCIVNNDVKVMNYSQGLNHIKNCKAYGYRNKTESAYGMWTTYSEEFNRYMFPMFDLLEEKEKEFIFVQAAGNDGIDADLESEYNYVEHRYFRDRYIVVGAVEENCEFVSTLNGNDWESSWGNGVDIVAPGNNIYSTIRGGGCGFGSGTSMAAPHVTGVAAMIWSINPALTGPEVKQILISNGNTITAETTGGTFRYPMLDAYACVQEAFANAKGNGQLNLQVFDKDTQKGVYDYNISIEPLEICQEKESITVNGVTVSPYVKQLKLGKYRVVVSKNGYKPYTEIITVMRDSEINLNVTLTPTEAPTLTQGTLEGKVVFNSAGVENIEVKVIQKDKLIATLVTNEDGKFSIDLDPGDYLLNVQVNGYVPMSASATVFKGKKTNTGFELSGTMYAVAKQTLGNTITHEITMHNMKQSIERIDIEVVLSNGYTYIDTANGINAGTIKTGNGAKFEIDYELAQGAQLRVTASDKQGKVYSGSLVLSAGGWPGDKLLPTATSKGGYWDKNGFFH